jgi:hypothetical protein
MYVFVAAANSIPANVNHTDQNELRNCALQRRHGRYGVSAKNQCVYKQYLFIKATKSIKEGDELLFNYGMPSLFVVFHLFLAGNIDIYMSGYVYIHR